MDETNSSIDLAFTSEKAVPGPKGAKWDAKTPEEFEASIKHLGDQMLDELFKTSTGRTKEGDVGDYGKDKKGTATNLKGCVPVGIMIVAGIVTMINLMA